MESTLNVRINSTLKKRGDKVLKDNGLSTSAAIRALWEELASSKRIPSFMQKADDLEKIKESKKALLHKGIGIARGRLSDASDAELKEILYAKHQ